jgi:hypothetical protein
MNGIDKKKHNDPAKQSVAMVPKEKDIPMNFLWVFIKK